MLLAKSQLVRRSFVHALYVRWVWTELYECSQTEYTVWQGYSFCYVGTACWSALEEKGDILKHRQDQVGKSSPPTTVSRVP